MITKLLTAKTQGMAPIVLAQHQFGIRYADGLRGHNLICEAVLEHPVLMDAGLVRESIAADDGLVRLHWNSGNFLEHLACRIKFLAGDASLVGIAIGTHSQRHHD